MESIYFYEISDRGRGRPLFLHRAVPLHHDSCALEVKH